MVTWQKHNLYALNISMSIRNIRKSKSNNHKPKPFCNLTSIKQSTRSTVHYYPLPWVKIQPLLRVLVDLRYGTTKDMNKHVSVGRRSCCTATLVTSIPAEKGTERIRSNKNHVARGGWIAHRSPFGASRNRARRTTLPSTLTVSIRVPPFSLCLSVDHTTQLPQCTTMSFSR